VKLPVISGAETIKILIHAGFVQVRQKGDHVRLEKYLKNETLKITVPLHRELKKGTLLRILKDTRITREELEALK